MRPERTAWLTHTGSGMRGPAVLWGRLHAAIYRRTGGRVLPRWFGAPVMVLETVGRRTGEPRSTPILPFQDRTLRESYVNGSLSVHHGGHELKFGGEALFASIHDEQLRISRGFGTRSPPPAALPGKQRQTAAK